MTQRNTSAPTCAPTPGPEPSDLQVAISVGQQLLDSSEVLALREALRLILRALGALPTCPVCGHTFEDCTCTGAHPERRPAVTA